MFEIENLNFGVNSYLKNVVYLLIVLELSLVDGDSSDSDSSDVMLHSVWTESTEFRIIGHNILVMSSSFKSF